MTRTAPGSVAFLLAVALVGSAGATSEDESPPAIAGAAEKAPTAAPATCTYRTYAWSVKARRGVDHQTITKPYAEVTSDERDPNDPRCTVCREDQQAIEIDGLPPVTVCRHWASQVRTALVAIKAGGFRVERLEGYRPGRTRGAVKDDLRTEWSNHSFGTAVDVNAHHNGLYNRCKLAAPPTRAADLAGCKLGMGGKWDPAARPKTTIVEGGVVHTELTRFWKWGGALPGALKDFMHFSITGE